MKLKEEKLQCDRCGRVEPLNLRGQASAEWWFHNGTAGEDARPWRRLLPPGEPEARQKAGAQFAHDLCSTCGAHEARAWGADLRSDAEVSRDASRERKAQALDEFMRDARAVDSRKAGAMRPTEALAMVRTLLGRFGI